MRVTKEGALPADYQPPRQPINLLVLGNAKDRSFLDALRVQFASDSRIKVVDPHEVLPGRNWANDRDAAIKSAECVVFLISADFFGSTVYDEGLMVLSRRKDLVEAGLVLNLICRPVHWQDSPFGSLPVLVQGRYARSESEMMNAMLGIKEVLKDSGLLK